MFQWLHNPEYNYATVLGATFLFGTLSLLAFIFFPSHFGIVTVMSIFLSLTGWRWYYSEWVENSLHGQPQEKIGNAAILMHLRLAAFGAAALIFVLVLFALILNRDVTSTPFLFLCGAIVLAVPVSMVSPTVTVWLVKILKEVCEVPFNVAILWMAVTTDEGFLGPRLKTLNKNGQRLLAWITGYSSNLSILHEADYIVSHFPKR